MLARLFFDSERSRLAGPEASAARACLSPFPFFAFSVRELLQQRDLALAAQVLAAGLQVAVRDIARAELSRGGGSGAARRARTRHPRAGMARGAAFGAARDDVLGRDPSQQLALHRKVFCFERSVPRRAALCQDSSAVSGRK